VRQAFARITIDGASVEAESGISVAAALMNSGRPIRVSVTGEARSAVCGMGICQECRVTIDGRAHQRACLTAVRDGMVITRDA
jgi:predicted molibdopterin-dependent oxidoreductase YjgC